MGERRFLGERGEVLPLFSFFSFFSFLFFRGEGVTVGLEGEGGEAERGGGPLRRGERGGKLVVEVVKGRGEVARGDEVMVMAEPQVRGDTEEEEEEEEEKEEEEEEEEEEDGVRGETGHGGGRRLGKEGEEGGILRGDACERGGRRGEGG